MHLIRNRKLRENESGQILFFFALVLPLLFLFVGFAIDFGFGFLAKAELAKACDAAALTTMRHLGQGDRTAKAIGTSEFFLNYNANWKFNILVSPPSININHSGSEPIVDVRGTATIRTFFIGLAGFHSLTVANFAEATRPPVIISLVLDKSGSMNYNGGAAALPPSVLDFLGYFVNGTDRLGEVSFSSTATQDVAISQRFQTPITNFVNSLKQQGAFVGGTFAQGGLSDALTEVTGVPNPPANAVPVVVFFTDGWANSIQSTVAGNPVDFGGCATKEWGPNPPACGGISCWDAANGKTIDGRNVPNVDTQVTCDGVNSFVPQDTNTAEIPTNPARLTITNISYEADYRAVQLANSMRAQGITVYSIGLGDKINRLYLQRLANDPASDQYNANLPQGVAVFADEQTDPGSLDQAFQQIAGQIILRLTQ